MKNIKHVLKERKIAYHQAVSAWCLKMTPCQEEQSVEPVQPPAFQEECTGKPGRLSASSNHSEATVQQRTLLRIPFNKRNLHDMTPEERDILWTEHTVANYLNNQRGYRKYKRFVKRVHPRFI